MAFILGHNAKAYRNTGTYGTPVWDEVPNLHDLKVSLAMDKFNARRRASGVFNQEAVTGITLTVTGRMLYDLADTDFTTLMAAAVALTEKDMIFLSGAYTSGAHQGPRADWGVSKFDRDEGEANVVFVDMEFVAGITNVPTWFTGTA